MTTFNEVQLTGITINIKTGEIKISARVGLNDENLEKAQGLEPYLDSEAGHVTLEITPMQIPMKLDKHGRGE